MKKYLYHIAALACATAALAGCIQNEEWTSGTPIKFGAAAQAGNLTRTSYGDIVDGSPRKQMIDWCADDTLRIVCAQASTAETGTYTYADYKTSAGVRYNNSAESRATLSLTGDNKKGLRWGSTDVAHVFYAVYPSPAAKSGDALTTAGALTGKIPAVQEPDSINNASPYKALPDMKNQYMVAKRTVEAGKQKIGDDEVFLYFTPITTAIQFGIKNKMDSDLAIQSIEISSASKNLSGTFTTSLTGLNEDGGKPYPAVTAGDNATKAAAVSFGTTGLTLAEGDSLTFTIFLLPESDLNDLTFKIFKVGGGTIKTALKYDENTWIPFGRCQKHFINGLFVNEGAIWTLCFDPEIFPWDHKAENKDLVDPPASGAPKLIYWSAGEEKNIYLKEPNNYQFSLATGVPDTQSFTNPESGREKTFNINSTKNSTISQNWKIKSVGGVDVSGTSFTTADGDLMVEKDSEGNLKVTDLRQKVSNGDNKHWTNNSAGNVWYSQSWGSEPGGLNKGTVDLSKYDFKSDSANAHSMRTANCYIIRHAGTYKIPLVYGNAIDHGINGLTNGKNTQAYAPTIASGGSNSLTPFVNHLGNGIFDPYIENNTDDGDPKWYTAPGKKTDEAYNNYISASNASVVWQDNGEVIKNISISITGDPLTRNKTNTDATANTKYTGSNVRYIKFSISQEDICQCNAIIAVKDASNNIMWSWHIWVTNDPVLSNGPVTVNSTYKFLPSPCIGWIEPQMYEGKEDVTIVLEQEESGETMTVTVKQLLYDNFSSNGTYYQWGRKDPMRASDVDTCAAPKSIANSIIAPGTFFKSSGPWCSQKYDNLWTGRYSQAPSTAVDEVTGMIKTVYDPSPVGYKVSAPNAFAGIDDGISSEITLVAIGYCDRGKGYWGNYISGYWTSVAQDSNAYCYVFPIKGSATTYLTHKNRSEGLAVRPVQE